jgi:hypothetical protein
MVSLYFFFLTRHQVKQDKTEKEPKICMIGNRRNMFLKSKTSTNQFNRRLSRLAPSTASLRGDSTVYRGIRLWNVLPSVAKSGRGISIFRQEAEQFLSVSEESLRIHRPHQHHQLY